MATIDPGLRAIAELERTSGHAAEAMFEARAFRRTETGARRIPVLIVWEGGIEPLEQAGVRVRSAQDGIVTADLPTTAISQLRSLRGGHFELARPMKRELDISLPEMKGTLVHAGPPAIRGTGVIIGIVDSGIDYQHGGFRTPEGQTRIRAIWDQNLNARPNETPPAGFTYGVEYKMARINQALAMQNPLTKVRHQDDDIGHGTHVAGIAAGDGSDAGNGRPPSTFVGVAPEAEIILVSNKVTTAALGDSVTTLEGVRYIFDTAAALARPCVVNMSQGDNIGPHDGTSPLEIGLDRLLNAPGRAFVKSAGNEGASNRHASGRLAQGASEQMAFDIDVDDPTPETIDIWYGAADRFTFRIQPPGGSPSIAVTAGQEPDPIVLPNGNHVIVTSTVDHPLNRQNRINVTLSPGGTSSIASGRWNIVLTGATVAPNGGTYHAWIERGHPSVTAEFVSANRGRGCTISIPGTGHRIITAGSYATNGTSAGNLSSFSSRGPTRDGRQAPTLCAPGQVITSARARTEGSGSGPYLGMQGTSMAAPHVAGVVALMLSVNPALTQEEIKDRLQRTARSDAFTGPSVNDDNWGRGKLDAQAAVRVATLDSESPTLPEESALRPTRRVPTRQRRTRRGKPRSRKRPADA
jgi:subtilisin family serine protease